MGGKHKSKAVTPELPVGTYVLLGGSFASMPSTWFFGRILWSGSGEILVERSTMNGQTWRQTAYSSEVRAHGSIADLVVIQRQASEATRELQRGVLEAESALGRARAALHTHLEKLASGDLKIIPADFEKIAADHAETRDAIIQSEAEWEPQT